MVEFNIDPVPKPRMTRADAWKMRPCVTQYWAFKDRLVYLAKLKKFELPDEFRVEFLIKMPDSWSEKKKLFMLGKPHQQRPDYDNLGKALSDCLRKEDKTIWHVDISKTWWHEGKIIIYEI